MTVKEIAEFTGKTEKTIQRWIIKAGDKMSSVNDKMSSAGHGKVVNYTVDEVECILTSGSMSKDAVSILMDNARSNTKDLSNSSLLTAKDIELITAITAGVVSKVMDNIDKRVTSIESKVEERKALLPAPKISPRQNVSKVVREYAIKNGLSYKEVYNKLYTDFGYRTHINVSVRAKNRDMAKMDYIEAEGLIDTLEAVAIDTMGY